MIQNSPLLEVKNLTKYYFLDRGLFKNKNSKIHAVDNVSLSLKAGKTLALVGESGSGKSTLGKLILKLETPTFGSVFFNGINITQLKDKEFRPYRKEIQIIFQDPFANLNPKFSVKKILSEPFEIHGLYLDKKERLDVIKELLHEVGINPGDMDKYPHELSGGQKQRIGIARAIALKPKLIVCDEPVSALDVSIQSQILNLLMSLRDKYSLSLLFISHNLAVVEQIADDIAVMNLGQIIEYAPVQKFFLNPLHPYSQALLSCVPQLKVQKRVHALLQGEMTSPINPPMGCRFQQRCPFSKDICIQKDPELKAAFEDEPKHLAACHFAGICHPEAPAA